MTDWTRPTHGGGRRRVLIAANIGGRDRAGGHRVAIEQWSVGFADAGFDVTTVDVVSAPRPRGHFDLVVNVMGVLPSGTVDADQWVFLDIDPGYPQMWHELQLADLLANHDDYVTLGERIGKADCWIPSCGRKWVSTSPPVDVGAWPVSRGGSAFTTVATWRNSYGTVDFDGHSYGSRVHEFRKFMELPRLVEAEFELALDIHAEEVDDLVALEANGWRLVDPQVVASTPEDYGRFIRESAAELGVAQQMYVATRSGWLSDRSICYLASGKPVLAQDTGFSERYPVGDGLIAFSTLEEAAAGVDEIERNYAHHSRAARALAEEFFDAAVVVPALLENLGIATLETIT